MTYKVVLKIVNKMTGNTIVNQVFISSEKAYKYAKLYVKQNKNLEARVFKLEPML